MLTLAATSLAAVYFLSIFSVTGQDYLNHVPRILEPLKNQTAIEGRSVSFSCSIDLLGDYRMAWIKADMKIVLAMGTHVITHDRRFRATHNGHNTWTLHIDNVRLSDAGLYMCQINTDPFKSTVGLLDVVVPPDILDGPGNNTEIAFEGSSIYLHCSATGVPQPKVLWRRFDYQDIVIRHKDGSARRAQRLVDGPSLHLHHVRRSDTGVYTCTAANGVAPTVVKNFNVTVVFSPDIKATIKFVPAMVSTRVHLQCKVESPPKPINTWYKEIVSGRILIREDPGKYYTKETYVDSHTSLMDLFIETVNAEDFGMYTCSSENKFGREEAAILLHEIVASTTTTSPATTSQRPTTISNFIENEETGTLENKTTSTESLNSNSSGTAFSVHWTIVVATSLFLIYRPTYHSYFL